MLSHGQRHYYLQDLILSVCGAFDFVIEVVQRIWSLYAPKFVTEHPLHHTVFQ